MTIDAGPDAGFVGIWERAATIPGWLTRAQALALWRAAGAADGTVVEIGSHQGRSTIVLAASAQGRVVAIDPFVDGPMFGGAATRDKFLANVDSADVGADVELIAEPSTAVRPGWREPIGLLYIDGKHDYWTVRDDLRWADHVRAGGAVLEHDAYSSIGVTLALLRHVLPGRRLRYLGRVGSLARFEVGAASGRDRARMLRELPWWLRNIAIKVVLRVARLAGHRRPDPY
jgi:hypothetical protein